MIPKHITMALVAASLAAAPTAPAMARGGDAVVGAIIGGIIGGAIANEANKKKKVGTKSVSKKPSVSSAQRDDNRRVQTALNYFGFAAGTPDGVFGQNSRRAVSDFQRAMGYPVTGQLTQFEHDFLLDSHRRAEAGGSNTLALIAQNPMGAVGLLVAWRDELAGGPGLAAAAPQVPDTRMVAVTPEAPPPAAAPAVPAAPAPVVVAAPPPAALPSFGIAPVGTQVSLTSHCNQVSLVTGTNGGYATLASMTDPDQALNEQFCLARTYAITTGEGLLAQIPGMTPAAVADQCKAFGPVMAGPVAALATEPPAAVLGKVQGVIATAGMAPAQLASTAQICLSVGYRTDDMGVAVGSALLLAGLGEGAYGELLGHHLMRGFGTAANPGLAKSWFQVGMDALDAGQPAVFAPGQPERADLIRAVVFGQRPVPAPVPAGATDPVRNSMPGVSINN
jgi:peptidoglycan hydrolase-like protein with peptidoglycan-binding domain